MLARSRCVPGAGMCLAEVWVFLSQIAKVASGFQRDPMDGHVWTEYPGLRGRKPTRYAGSLERQETAQREGQDSHGIEGQLCHDARGMAPPGCTHLPRLVLTFLPQQEGVEAQVVDGQVEPALPGHSALPVAAGVVVDQLLTLRHPKLLPHLQLGLLEFSRVLISLGLQVLVLFCNDTLEGDSGTWVHQDILLARSRGGAERPTEPRTLGLWFKGHRHR